MKTISAAILVAPLFMFTLGCQTVDPPTSAAKTVAPVDKSPPALSDARPAYTHPIDKRCVLAAVQRLPDVESLETEQVELAAARPAGHAGFTQAYRVAYRFKNMPREYRGVVEISEVASDPPQFVGLTYGNRIMNTGRGTSPAGTTEKIRQMLSAVDESIGLTCRGGVYRPEIQSASREALF